MSTSPDSVTYVSSINGVGAFSYAPQWFSTNRPLPGADGEGLFGFALDTGEWEWWDGVEWLTFATIADASLARVKATGGTTYQTLADWFQMPVYAAGFGVSPTATAAVNSAAINAAILYASATLGGGMVILPSGTLNVAITAGSTCIIMKSNVALVGQSRSGTKLVKAAGNGHVIQASTVDNWSVMSLTVDGGRIDASFDGHGIRVADSDKWRVFDCFIQNCNEYGIGAQDGDITNGSVKTVWIKNTGHDGIDFKNKSGANNYSNAFDDIHIENFDLNIDTQQAGIDIRGPATLTNIHVIGAFTSGSSGVRFRIGEPADANGDGGHYASMSSFYIRNTTGAVGNGVEIDARSVNISNGTVRNMLNGIRTTPGVSVSATDDGISNITAWECTTGFVLQGTAETVTGCHAKVCTTGFSIVGTSASLVGNVSRGSTTGFLIDADATYAKFVGNTSLGDTTAISDSGTFTRRYSNVGFRNTDETGYVSQRYYGQAFIGASTTQIVTENRLYFCPISLTGDITVDAVAFHISTGAGDAQCQARVGLYSFSNGAPNRRLVDYGFVTVGTGTGAQTIATSATIPRGIYAIALIFNRNAGATGTMPTLTSYTDVNSYLRDFFGTTSASFSSGSFTTYQYADIAMGTWASYTLPATAPAITRASTAAPTPSFRAV